MFAMQSLVGHTPWWWRDPIVLAQLQVVFSVVGALFAAGAVVYAWRVAKRQFGLMDEQGRIVEKQLRMMEDHAATGRRIEEVSRQQATIAKTQHEIMLDQLARKPDLKVFLRGLQPSSVLIGNDVTSATDEYLISVKNSGNKTAKEVSWRIFLAAEPSHRGHAGGVKGDASLNFRCAFAAALEGCTIARRPPGVSPILQPGPSTKRRREGDECRGTIRGRSSSHVIPGIVAANRSRAGLPRTLGRV